MNSRSEIHINKIISIFSQLVSVKEIPVEIIENDAECKAFIRDNLKPQLAKINIDDLSYELDEVCVDVHFLMFESDEEYNGKLTKDDVTRLVGNALLKCRIPSGWGDFDYLGKCLWIDGYVRPPFDMLENSDFLSSMDVICEEITSQLKLIGRFENKEIKMNSSEITAAVSGILLTKNLPEDWSSLSEENLYNYISENAWEPFENWQPNDVLNCIEDIATIVSNVIEDGIEFGDDEAFMKASGIFLTEEVPSNWDDLSEDEQNSFMSENVWEPFEDCEPNVLWELIENTANDLKDIVSDANTNSPKM